jgi:hypothetical protein
MKTTDAFKKTIQAELQRMADADPLFAKSLAKENKNIDDCITYILNQVQKSGCNGFADEEIYGMAAHYYDEDDLDPGKPIKVKVVVNQTPELTADDMAEAKRKAMEQAIEQEKARLSGKVKPKAEEPKIQQLSLI